MKSFSPWHSSRLNITKGQGFRNLWGPFLFKNEFFSIMNSMLKRKNNVINRDWNSNGIKLFNFSSAWT